MKLFAWVVPIKFKISILLFIFTFVYGNIFAQEMHHEHPQTNDSTEQRQKMIHSESHRVMPFTMNEVTHYFISREDGGVLMIKVKDPEDTLQISLIRDHLKKEQKLFSKGDFRDPEALHGKGMPGVKTLSESAGKLNVGYKKLPDGAMLRFASKDTAVINAVHIWFEAQLKDHGRDARDKE